MNLPSRSFRARLNRTVKCMESHLTCPSKRNSSRTTARFVNRAHLARNSGHMRGASLAQHVCLTMALPHTIALKTRVVSVSSLDASTCPPKRSKARPRRILTLSTPTSRSGQTLLSPVLRRIMQALDRTRLRLPAINRRLTPRNVSVCTASNSRQGSDFAQKPLIMPRPNL